MKYQDFKDLHELETSLWWFVGMENISKTLLSEHPELIRSRFLCDAGCGTGGNITFLRSLLPGLEYATGIDISPDALHFCASSGVDATLVEASATAIPLPDESCDLVTSFDVLVQLPRDGSDAQNIAEMHRILRPGGYAFVRAAALGWLRSEHDKALGSQYRYTTKELQDLFQQHGFTVLRTTYANTFLLPIVILHRLILKKLRLTQSGSDVQPLSPFLNRIFTTVLNIEARLLKYISLPIGSSAIIVAQKNGASQKA